MAATVERELGAGGDLLTSATARAAALSRAAGRAREVAAPCRTWRRPDGVVACELPLAPGSSLVELDVAGVLTVGQVVTVGVAVAKALASMHAERISHGDVSPGNVMALGTRITLVDTMGALFDKRGTPMFSAPDRDLGASPAGDVYSLGQLMRWLAGPEAVPTIDAWTAPLLAESAAERPTAAHAAAAIARCGAPQALPTRLAPVAAAMRSSVLVRTAPHPADRWWRIERAAIRVAPVAALVAVAVAVGVNMLPAVAEPVPSPDAAQEVELPVNAEALMDPAIAAEALTKRRIEALASGDVAALSELNVPGSAAHTRDAGLMSELANGTIRFEGLAVEAVSARVLDIFPGGATVEVTSELSDYSVGRETVGEGTAIARLRLRLTDRGWRVERVLPPP